jgi:hypothetical protein
VTNGDHDMRSRTTAEFVETYTFPFVVSAWLFLTTVLVVIWGIFGYLTAMLVCVGLHTILVPLDRRAAAIRKADDEWRPGGAIRDDD